MNDIINTETELSELEEVSSSDERIDESESIGEKEVELFCYNERLKDFVKEVAKTDGLDDVEFGRAAQLRMQESIKFIATALIFEIVGILKRDMKVRIKPKHVDEAVTRMLHEADGLQISITKLSQLTEELGCLVNKTSLDKATWYVNGLSGVSEGRG